MSSIAREIQPMIESIPEMPIHAIQSQLLRNHQLETSLHKVIRAKRIATTRIYGDYQEQYGLPRSYCDELLKANPGSPTRQFRRIYVCFTSVMRGFKMIGRLLLGVDGCFMKGPFLGQILSAVGIDGNNSIYPEYLQFVLQGLIPATLAVFPNGEQRFCLRHIHENMKSKWRGDVYKNLLWSAGRKTSIPYFNKAMEEIKTIERAMYAWLNEIPYTAWSRAYFSGRAKRDMLLNNICEVFNRQIIGAWDKPIITCLEFNREYITKRIVNVKKLQAKCMGPLIPHATEVFDKIKKHASVMSVLMVDTDKYQVTGPRSQCVVNIKHKTYACRKWDLTGMPCKHAVAAIWDMSRNSINAGIPEEWVSDVYWLSTWKNVYENVIEPINGPNMWTPSHCPTTLIPPKHHTQVRRPKKKQKKAFGEKELEKEFDKGGKRPEREPPPSVVNVETWVTMSGAGKDKGVNNPLLHRNDTLPVKVPQLTIFISDGSFCGL
ncbi:uncharacterized protein LOC110889518 [Helianthus annuus]|uniref:uncharacterized protein LOC110889518 n=1 Tax=Helianthus annuus TaxID=4232 RepID=UPI000B8F6398|nr:uncharacterized protein LOC110889518 [Helianthus annuus]